VGRLDIAIESQRAALQAIKDAGEPLDDNVTIKKNYNWFNIEYKASDRSICRKRRQRRKGGDLKNSIQFSMDSFESFISRTPVGRERHTKFIGCLQTEKNAFQFIEITPQ